MFHQKAKDDSTTNELPTACAQEGKRTWTGKGVAAGNLFPVKLGDQHETW